MNINNNLQTLVKEHSIILHYATRLNTTLHHATPINTTLHHARPINTTLHHATPINTTLHHARPINTTLHHATPINTDIKVQRKACREKQPPAIEPPPTYRKLLTGPHPQSLASGTRNFTSALLN